MARPILLIKKELLNTLYDKHKQGVPYSRLIRDHNLEISAPKLKDLLFYYDAYIKYSIMLKQSYSEQCEKFVSEVYNSLFPEWLTEDVQSQNSSEWQYMGRMPLGKWVKLGNKTL